MCILDIFFVSNKQRQSTICFFIARWLDNCGTYLPFRFRGTNWTMPQRASQAIESRNNEGSGSTDQSRWRIVPAVIWWTIWKERNMRCFESVSSPLHRIKINCTITFCYWCSLEYVDDPIAVRDILGPL